MNRYETQGYLNEYLLFHYGTSSQKCRFSHAPREAMRFHERIIPESILPLRFPSPTRGLDLGCAVGRLTFELATKVDHALGIDNANLLIDAARRMATERKLRVKLRDLGRAASNTVVRLPKRLYRRKVMFKVEDALTFRSPPVHVVVAINLICRLPQPRRFLKRLRRLVVPGGQLVLGSPYTWLAEYTAPRQWLTPEAVREILRPDFRLVRRQDMPFLIRETERKYQWVVSDVMTWVRK